MLSELYDEGEGTLIYDLETATPVGVQRTAEYFRVQNGKIVSILLIFDATKWHTILGTGTLLHPNLLHFDSSCHSDAGRVLR